MGKKGLDLQRGISGHREKVTSPSERYDFIKQASLSARSFGLKVHEQAAFDTNLGLESGPKDALEKSLKAVAKSFELIEKDNANKKVDSTLSHLRTEPSVGFRADSDDVKMDDSIAISEKIQKYLVNKGSFRRVALFQSEADDTDFEVTMGEDGLRIIGGPLDIDLKLDERAPFQVGYKANDVNFLVACDGKDVIDVTSSLKISPKSSVDLTFNNNVTSEFLGKEEMLLTANYTLRM